MKRMLVCLGAAAILALYAGPALAQTDDLSDFKTPDDEIERPLLPQAANPLGAAAGLPIGLQGASDIGLPQTAEELAVQMQEQAAEQRKLIEEQTFDAALKQLLPMKPEEIRKTLEAFKFSREAAETPITVPTPMQVVRTLSLDAADTPIIVKMAPGHVTTITIVDSTGAPWPIQDVGWAGRFDVSPPESGGHVIRITPLTAHGMGNMSIRLVDLITPVVMQLGTGIDEVYYRLDARVPKPGPLAKTPIIEYGGLQAVAGRDDNLTGVLEGTPPAGAERLTIKGVDGRTMAWKISDRIYLRTPLTMLSPGWDSSVTSADGVNVYTFEKAPVVLLSDQGRMVRANIAAEGVSP
jgi:intracellular multiplication protein IcmK